MEKSTFIDYKDVKTLTGFTPERGKVLPRRTSGVCALHQRMLVEAIKRARNIALLPFADRLGPATVSIRLCTTGAPRGARCHFGNRLR